MSQRIDQLVVQAVDRSRKSVVQYKMVRGRLSALLITCGVTFHYKDIITVKLRHAGGNKTVVDRISGLRLALLTDLKQGMPTTGTPDYIGTIDGENNENHGYVNVNQGVRYYLNAILLPLGHITLDGGEELEITVELAKMDAPADGSALPTGNLKISSVQGKPVADYLLCYDCSDDLESNEPAIREVYACGVNNQSLFNNASDATYGVPEAKDVNIRLKVDGDDSFNDIETYSAMTAITGQFNAQPSSLIRVYQALESLPADIYIKVYGEDARLVELLYIREDRIPHMVGASLASALDVEKKRVEKLEQNEPDKARALIQTGQIASSEKITAAQEKFVAAVPPPVK